MDPNLNNWIQLIFRWGHVVAGVLWIGMLWFFNWVNGPLQAKLDAGTKKVLVPELMPRALFWFRWGAAWTWITGFVLAGLIYYQTKEVLFDPDHIGNPWLWLAITLVTMAVGFVIYNLVMKKVKNVLVANAIVLAMFVGVYCLLECVGHYSGRALYIHAGIIFGTTMALNVWMVIWPYQQKIIRGVKDGVPADAEIVRQAGLRSRHNTFMSIPLLFTMISNHYPTVYGSDPWWCRDLYLAGIIVVGFVFVRLLYGKAGKVSGF
jgi:uncharacterized membrane protein